MLHHELPCAAVVVLHMQHLADDAPPWLAFDMNDVIDGFADLGLDVLIGRLLMAA